MSRATTLTTDGARCQDVGVSRSGVWGGRTAEQRQVERRTRMISAAINIWSSEGWPAVSMRRICAETSVNDRYFYEEFGDKDGLLAAAWETVRDDVLGVLRQAYEVWGVHPSAEEMTHQVATALLDWMTLNPTFSRILLSRDESSQALKVLHRNAFHQAVDMVLDVARPRMKSGFDEEGLKMDAVAAIGGFIELLRSWQSGYLDVDAHRIAEHASAATTRYTGRHRGK
jgi:AcrR family transcriptional regulator